MNRIAIYAAAGFCVQRPFLRRQSGTVQRLRWMSERCADDVPDLPGNRRRSHVDAWPRECDPKNFAVAEERTRFARVRGIRCGAEQLSFVQGLHARVSVECKSSAAESGAAPRCDSQTWVELAGADSKPARFLGRSRLHVSATSEHSVGFRALPPADGERNRLIGQTDAAEIHERTV